MLIIFDLDDTLIDTTGSIAPGLLRNALRAMGEEGLALADFGSAYKQLLHLNRHHLSTKSALQEFLEIYEAPPSCFSIGMREIYEQPLFDLSIAPLEGAAELLLELAELHQLVLVTNGVEDIQREKIRRANLPIQVFSYLHFCQKGEGFDSGKKFFYAAVQKESKISPDQTLVCGDRITIDLSPAKELGYKTVQIKWGRGLGNTGLKKDVDYTILHLRELKLVLEQLK